MEGFNLSIFAEIIRNAAIDFEKINTNIGEINVRKLEKTYHCYEIPTDEKIIAFFKTHFLGITVNGCVFTDKAFYPRPVFLNSAPSKGDLAPVRIDYADFGKYLIIQSDEKDALFMRNKDKNYFITFSTLTNPNVTGCEIRKLLLAIQDYLCSISSTAKQGIKEIAEDYFERISNEIKTDRLSLEFSNLLKGMITANYFCLHAFDLLAEGIYRLCNENEYFSLVNKYSNMLTNEKYEYYINTPPKFKDNLMADLSNPNLVFSAQYINTIQCNLAKEKDTEENQKYYIFACIRAGNIIKARLKINELINCFGRETAFVAENFACIYGNKKMQDIIAAINSNQDIPKNLYNITDGLGLTALHYAIILNRKNIIRKLCESTTFYKNIEYCQSNKVISLLDYTTVAFLQNMELLTCVISNTSSEMTEFYLQRKELEKQIEKANTLIQVLERQSAKLGRKQNAEFIKKIFRGNFNLDDTPEDKEYYQNQQAISDSVQKLKKLRWDTEKVIEDLEVHERETYQTIIRQIFQTAKGLENDKSPFVEFFIALYKNDANKIPFSLPTMSEKSTAISNETVSHIILKILEISNTSSCFKIYEYDGFFFMLPDCINLDMPHRKIHITNNGIVDNYTQGDIPHTSKYPKYGDSWFSKEAHNNMQVLKREYRELVKKYHPDICADAEASAIFATIHNEYESINS